MKVAIEIIAGVSFFVVAYVVPFIYVLCTERVWKGMLLSWGLAVGFFIVLTIPVYELVWHYNEELTAGLPEGNSIVAVVISGWLPGFIVAVAAALTRRAIKHFRPSSFSATSNQSKKMGG